MLKNTPAQVLLELDSHVEKSAPKPKLPLKKLNLKDIRACHSTLRNPPPNQSSSKRGPKSARESPNHSIFDMIIGTKDLPKQDINTERYPVCPLPKASAIPKKSLPNLYTENLQKNVTDKLEALKEKYGVLYKYMLKANGINVEKEDLKAVMKKSKPIFDSTYSIKYFGVLDSQFSIVSQRVPIKNIYTDIENARTPQQLSKANKFYHQEQTGLNKHLMKDQASTPSIGFNSLEQYEGAKRDSLPQSLIAAQIMNEKKIFKDRRAASEHHVAIHNAEIEEIKRQVTNAGSPRVEDLHYQLVPASQKTITITNTDVGDRVSHETGNGNYESNMLSERPMRGLRKTGITDPNEQKKTQSSEKVLETRIITSYSLPRQMHAVRKRRQKVKEDYIAAYKNMKTNYEEPEPQEPPLLKGRNTTKVEPPRKEYIDELSIPEKFRTHEVRALMTNKANYSYSKLLSTLYSKEKPENILIENTKKIEEIKIKREEMKRAYQQMVNEQKRGRVEHRNITPREQYSEEDEQNLFAVKGPFYVKIIEPCTNPMYNAFSKIRERVENGGGDE